MSLRKFSVIVCCAVVTLFVGLIQTSYAVPYPSSSGMALWLRADQGITLNSGRVSGWADQSGSGNHVSQATSTSQPLYGSSVGGQPAIFFDRTRGDFLNNTVSNILSAGSPRTIFVVADARSQVEGGPSNVGGSLLTFRRTTLVGNYQTMQIGSAHFVFTDGVNGANNATIPLSASAVISQPYISVFSAAQPNKIEVSLNSFDQTVTQSGGVSTETGTTGFTIGSREDQAATTYGYDGDIAEVIVYDHLLTADELNQTGTYLALRYGITTNFDFVFPVPEPSSLGLLSVGLLMLKRRRRRHQA